MLAFTNMFHCFATKQCLAPPFFVHRAFVVFREFKESAQRVPVNVNAVAETRENLSFPVQVTLSPSRICNSLAILALASQIPIDSRWLFSAHHWHCPSHIFSKHGLVFRPCDRWRCRFYGKWFFGVPTFFFFGRPACAFGPQQMLKRISWISSFHESCNAST